MPPFLSVIDGSQGDFFRNMKPAFLIFLGCHIGQKTLANIVRGIAAIWDTKDGLDPKDQKFRFHAKSKGRKTDVGLSTSAITEKVLWRRLRRARIG